MQVNDFQRHDEVKTSDVFVLMSWGPHDAIIKEWIEQKRVQKEFKSCTFT